MKFEDDDSDMVEKINQDSLKGDSRNQEVQISKQDSTRNQKNVLLEFFVDQISPRKYIVMAFLILVLGWTIWRLADAPLQVEAEQSAVKAVSYGELPRIVWIYTHGELTAQHANNIIYYYHLNHTFSQLGYDVRVVNSWTAYQWIKNESRIAQITYVIQNTRIDETVDSLLKLAILIQHGGIMIGSLNSLINTNFTWVQDMFKPLTMDYSIYTCDNPQVYMIEFMDNFFGIKFYEDLIVARPHSKLLQEGMEVLQNVLLSGEFPNNNELRVLKHRDYTNIDLLPYSIENSISYVIWRKLSVKKQNQDIICQEYGMQRTLRDFVFDLNDFPKKERVQYLFKSTERPKSSFIINTNTTSINEALGFLIDHPESIKELDPRSSIYEVLSAPGNRQIFFDAPPDRFNLSLCLIVMDDLLLYQMNEMISHVNIQEQEVDWTLVMFGASELSKETDRVSILQSEGNQIRNIEVAICKVCPKRSYAVLLHKGDRFNKPFALAKIVEALQPRFILGAAIGLDFEGKILNASEDYLSFSRSADGVVNPKIDLMEGILNHFRIFSVEAFRYIPQFDHVDIFGNYFKDRIIFLMTLLEMINMPREGYKYTYIYLKYYPVFNIPQTAVLIDSSIKIQTGYFDKVDMDQLKKTRARFDAEPVRKTMEEILGFDISFEKLLVFNPGNRFVPVNEKKGPDLIPKVIHQAWLGGKMGQAQEYFFNKVKVIYPDYELKLWGESDITRQNFPLSFEVINNLIDFNKNRGSAFSKLATVTDIMRHEILYHQGGFWRDAGMNMFKPIFNNFLKYDFVVGAERSLRHRWNQGMCFFANAPRSPHMARIVALPNINRMRIYGDVALDIAGPFDFRNTVIGYEEYSPSVLLLNFQYFYPGQVGRPPFGDLCTRYEKEYEGESFHFKYKGCYLLKDCEDKYPEAYALDHNCFGVSWLKRKA